MTDRWNSKLRTVDVVRPLKVFVPGDAPRPSLVEQRKGYVVRLRGDRDGTVVHAYRCPVHGVFDARVSRASVPDEVPCPSEVEDANFPKEHDLDPDDPATCGLAATWAGSFCGQGFAAGEVCS